MTLSEAIQLKTLHQSHSMSQSCAGCSLDVDQLIEEQRKLEEARETLSQESVV